jgi:hypothetical protein
MACATNSLDKQRLLLASFLPSTLGRKQSTRGGVAIRIAPLHNGKEVSVPVVEDVLRIEA